MQSYANELERAQRRMPRSRGLAVSNGWLLVSTILLAVGCARESEQPARSSADSPGAPGVIVAPAWVAERLLGHELSIIDTRPPDEFAAGHLPGAVNIPPDRLLGSDPEAERNMAPTRRIQDVFSAGGISLERPVVVYDGATYRAAARVFWVLEAHGHPRASVLNGGYGQWIASGFPVTTDAPEIQPSRFIANIQPDRLATRLTVLRALEDDSTVILDARSDAEFRGLLSKAKRKGHIRSAVNVDHMRNLVVNANGVCSLRLTNELIDLYRHELHGCSKVISYCNSGTRASVSYLALRAAGYEAAVYDGSWLEWGNESALPID